MSETAGRLVALSAAHAAHHPWYRRNAELSWRALLPCLLLEGTAEEVVVRVSKVTEELRQPWWKGLYHATRTGLAATLLAGGRSSGARFGDELERVLRLCIEQGLPRQRRPLAFLIATAALLPDPMALDRDFVRRLGTLYKAVRRQQWWLTNAADLPLLALLVHSGRAPEELARDQKALFDALRAQGRPWSNSLQSASCHLLGTGVPAADLADRLHGLWSGFREQGLRMQRRDEDELALLAARSAPTADLVHAVLADRDTLGALPWASRQARWELAVSTFCLGNLEGRAEEKAFLVTKALLDQMYLEDAQAAASA